MPSLSMGSNWLTHHTSSEVRSFTTSRTAPSMRAVRIRSMAATRSESAIAGGCMTPLKANLTRAPFFLVIGDLFNAETHAVSYI